MTETLTEKVEESNPTICDVHICKREKISPRDLESLNSYEREKNCCPSCEEKRIATWGRPTDEDIQKKASFYLQIKKRSQKEYQDLIDDANRFVVARENNDLDSLDQRVWMQFSGCERYGEHYWIDEDYKKLLDLIGE